MTIEELDTCLESIALVAVSKDDYAVQRFIEQLRERIKNQGVLNQE